MKFGGWPPLHQGLGVKNSLHIVGMTMACALYGKDETFQHGCLEMSAY